MSNQNNETTQGLVNLGLIGAAIYGGIKLVDKTFGSRENPEEYSNDIKALIKKLKKSDSPYEKSQIAFKAFEKLGGKDKEIAFEMFEYYSDIRDDLREMEDAFPDSNQVYYKFKINDDTIITAATKEDAVDEWFRVVQMQPDKVENLGKISNTDLINSIMFIFEEEGGDSWVVKDWEFDTPVIIEDWRISDITPIQEWHTAIVTDVNGGETLYTANELGF